MKKLLFIITISVTSFNLLAQKNKISIPITFNIYNDSSIVQYIDSTNDSIEGIYEISRYGKLMFQIIIIKGMNNYGIIVLEDHLKYEHYNLKKKRIRGTLLGTFQLKKNFYLIDKFYKKLIDIKWLTYKEKIESQSYGLWINKDLIEYEDEYFIKRTYPKSTYSIDNFNQLTKYLKYNLKYFSDEDYIKAYIEKDGIDTFEGIYDCTVHIPIRGTNLKGTYKIAIVNYKDHPSLLSNYKAYILRADCSDCSEWEIGDVLAFFRETKSGRYHIYWNHPTIKYENEDNIKIAIDFGSKKHTQVFNTEVIFSNRRLIFNIESEYIKDKSLKEFYDDESVTLDRIWPKSNIDTSSINNQEIDSSKDTNITREKAIVLLKELKELLDLGILTQEEFDKKAVTLKKIILEDNYPH